MRDPTKQLWVAVRQESGRAVQAALVSRRIFCRKFRLFNVSAIAHDLSYNKLKLADLCRKDPCGRQAFYFPR